MQNLIVGAVIVFIISYIIYVRRSKTIYDAIDDLISNKAKFITISQSFNQIKNTIQSNFKNVITTDKTIIFEYKFHSFVVAILDNNQVVISLTPTDEEVETFLKSENEILNTDKTARIERMKALVGNMIDDIISTKDYTRIYEDYNDFKEVFKEYDYPILKENENSFTFIVNRHMKDYKITILKEDGSFSAFWEEATLEDIMIFAMKDFDFE